MFLSHKKRERAINILLEAMPKKDFSMLVADMIFWPLVIGFLIGLLIFY